MAGAFYRVRVSANKKVRYKKANMGHLMSGKNGSRKRSLRRAATLKGPMRARILRAMQA